mgnify:CR=1 FL=1
MRKLIKIVFFILFFIQSAFVFSQYDINVTSKNKKAVKAYFPYGSYTKERTHRDYWLSDDQEFLACLVSIKVQRMSRRNQIIILDDIREFRLLTKEIATGLCESFATVGYKFSVYEEA